jgi:hypothetical protein
MWKQRSSAVTSAFLLAVSVSLLAAQGAAAETLPVDLDALSGFSSADKTKIDQAAQAMSEALSSEDFRQAVLSFTYDGKQQFSNNQLANAAGDTVATGMSNQQIYDTMMASRETYLNNTDETAHINLTLYTPSFYKKWNVVGYGYPGQPQIFMNWYYFNSYDIAQVAANIAHEWTHKLGFDHDYNRTARRPYSVPYGVGCLVEHLAEGTSTSSCAQASN